MKAFAASHAIILLLDSDPVPRNALHDLLQGAGYLVMRASELGAAVDRLAEARPDLLITRPYINSMPGRVAADYLRTKCPGLPVLIVAGVMDDDRVRVRNQVDQVYTFPEPYPREDLLNKVRELVAQIRQEGHAAHR